MENKQQRVAIYARVSSQEQATEGVSLDAQLVLLRAHTEASGDWPGGGTLYGYRWHNKDRKWEIVPEEADIVNRVYALYVGEKLGMIPITQRLNDDGYLTRKGFPWRANGVRQILTHPAYKGKHPVGIQVPSIVDEAMWQKAQDKRETARNILAAPKGLASAGHGVLRPLRACPEVSEERCHAARLLRLPWSGREEEV